MDQLRAYAWGDGRWTGRLLADESGAVVRADAGRHDPADGFVTAVILLRDRVRQGEWPDRLSYDPTAQRTEPAVPPPATPPVRRRSPTRPGFGLGTLAERARRNRSWSPRGSPRLGTTLTRRRLETRPCRSVTDVGALFWHALHDFCAPTSGRGTTAALGGHDRRPGLRGDCLRPVAAEPAREVGAGCIRHAGERDQGNRCRHLR